MFTKSQSDRITRRCTAAIVDAVDAFPTFLAQCEPESAAQIIADIIKAQLNRPESEEDPSAALNELIRLANSEENQSQSLQNNTDNSLPWWGRVGERGKSTNSTPYL